MTIEISHTHLKKWYAIQIYHVREGYLRKIPVERRTISRAKWRGKFGHRDACNKICKTLSVVRFM
jgi:hypothetical protein